MMLEAKLGVSGLVQVLSVDQSVGTSADGREGMSPRCHVALVESVASEEGNC